MKILPVAEEAKSVLWGTILNADAERESPFEVEHGGGVPLSKEKKKTDISLLPFIRFWR